MERDDARRYARLLALGRIGLGIAAFLAPRLPSAPWVGGGEAQRRSVKLMARALGARDIALGVGPVLALRHDTPVRGWVEAGGLADAGDLVATLLGWSSLPRRTRYVMLGIIAGSAAASRALAPAVD